MTPERKTQLERLRNTLKNLTPEQKQAMLARGLVATIEGRTLSAHNTILVYLQSVNNAPSVVGGFKQWLKANRVVKRGEHGLTIWFPVGNKNDNGDILEIDRYFIATVFDISQTEELKPNEPKQAPVMPVIKPVIERRHETKQAEDIMRGFQLVS